MSAVNQQNNGIKEEFIKESQEDSSDDSLIVNDKMINESIHRVLSRLINEDAGDVVQKYKESDLPLPRMLDHEVSKRIKRKIVEIFDNREKAKRCKENVKNREDKFFQSNEYQKACQMAYEHSNKLMKRYQKEIDVTVPSMRVQYLRQINKKTLPQYIMELMVIQTCELGAMVDSEGCIKSRQFCCCKEEDFRFYVLSIYKYFNSKFPEDLSTSSLYHIRDTGIDMKGVIGFKNFDIKVAFIKRVVYVEVIKALPGIDWHDFSFRENGIRVWYADTKTFRELITRVYF